MPARAGPLDRLTRDAHSARPLDTPGSAAGALEGPAVSAPRAARAPPCHATGDPMRSLPDLVCPACSKSIRSGTLVLHEHRECFHLGCRSRMLRAHALDSAAHAPATREQAARCVPESWSAALEHPRPSRRATRGVCPLCDGRTTVTDWRPSVDWLVIEHCACNGFFLWAELTKARLTKLARNRRHQLALQIRGLRASHKAWCATEDGTKPDCSSSGQSGRNARSIQTITAPR